MATYTDISTQSLSRFLYMFDLGELESFELITAGIENSNYFVTMTNETEYVLTITEGLDLNEVPFFNDLLQQLINARLPVPEPQRTLDGMASALLKGKPTWLFTRLPGSHHMKPSAAHCREIGRALATIHQQSERCRYIRENVYNSLWVGQSLTKIKHLVKPDDLGNLEAVAEDYRVLQEQSAELPRGIIHGDLFRDNALFVGDELTGVIDFYHACEDFLIQDIAIAINDWCTDGVLTEGDKQAAMIEGYHSVRQLSDEELDALQGFRVFSAMRFALTRLLANSDNPDRKPDAQLGLLEQLLKEAG